MIKKRLTKILGGALSLLIALSFVACPGQPEEQTEKTLSSISVDTSKATTSFYEGDTFTYSGIVVTATYSDNSTADVTSSATVDFDAVKMDTADSYLVTVNYTEGSVTKSASYSVTVKKDSLEGISVDGLQLTYTIGTSFSSEGITVTAHYESGKTADVSSSETVIVDDSAFDSSKTGVCNIKVSYTEGEGDNAVTKDANIEITVTNDVILTKISVDTTNAITSYTVGDTFSKDGIVITATYSNNSTKDVTSSATVESSVNTSAAGTYTVNISYTEGDNAVTKSTSYTVTVKDKVVPSSLTAKVSEITTISQLEEFDKNVATVTYSDGTSKDIDADDLEKIIVTDSEGNTVSDSSDESGESFSPNYGETYTITISYKESDVTVSANISMTLSLEDSLKESDNSKTLVGTAWWNEANQGTDAIQIETANDSVTYMFMVAADGNDCLVEVYDSANNYLSTTSQLTAWGGLTPSPVGKVLNDSGVAVVQNGTFKKGHIYTATVTYLNSYITVTYTDHGTSSTESTVLFTTSSTVEGTRPYNVHFVAQTGTFYVLENTTIADVTLDSISVNTDNATTSYTDGGTFSTSGVVVTANYSSGRTANVTSSATFSITDGTTLSYDENGKVSDNTETRTVTVTYGETSETYDITIANITLSSVALSSGVTIYTYNGGTTALYASDAKFTATYSDNSTKDISLSEATFADVSDGNVTFTYQGVASASITITDKTSVNDLYSTGVTAGNLINAGVTEKEIATLGTDAGWTGTTEAGAWWTIFAGDDVKVSSGKVVKTTMTLSTDNANANNYQLAPTVIARDSSKTEYAVVRLDNYGWKGSDTTAGTTLGWTLTSDWNWTTITTDLKGATVQIAMINLGDGTATIRYDVTCTDGTTHYQQYAGISVTEDNLYFNLCFEQIAATFVGETTSE